MMIGLLFFQFHCNRKSKGLPLCAVTPLFLFASIMSSCQTITLFFIVANITCRHCMYCRIGIKNSSLKLDSKYFDDHLLLMKLHNEYDKLLNHFEHNALHHNLLSELHVQIRLISNQAIRQKYNQSLSNETAIFKSVFAINPFIHFLIYSSKHDGRYAYKNGKKVSIDNFFIMHLDLMKIYNARNKILSNIHLWKRMKIHKIEANQALIQALQTLCESLLKRMLRSRARRAMTRNRTRKFS